MRPANKTSVNDTRTAASKKRVNGRRGVPYRQHNVHSRVQPVSYSRGHRIIRSFLTFDSIRIVSIFLFLPSPPTFHLALPFPVYLRQFPVKGSGNGDFGGKYFRGITSIDLTNRVVKNLPSSNPERTLPYEPPYTTEQLNLIQRGCSCLARCP